jgi:predicted dehydrogenase
MAWRARQARHQQMEAQMKDHSQLTRRDFLGSSTRTAAALGIGSAFTLTAGERRASAIPAGKPARIGANDTIRIGLIGAGGQGTHDTYQACRGENVICVAMADVAEFRLEDASRRIGGTMDEMGHKDIKIDRYEDYRRILDRKDIDAVVIATPDHWHSRPFIAAVQAGRHIYQEKPFSYTIEQGLEMEAEARKRPELTIQIGTQRRSGLQYPKAKKLIDDGEIGEIKYVRAFDCRNFLMGRDPFAPREVSGKIDWDKFQEPCSHKVEYDPWRYFAWRWFWDYAGGLVCDVGIHVMDVVHWLTGKTVPKSAVCNGGVYGLDYWETPDVVNAVWDYGSHCVAFVSNFTNGYEGDGLTLFGTKATIEIRGAHIYVWAEGNRDKPIHEFPPEGEKHQLNWIECIRSGEKPNAPVELGFSSLLPSHLANIAYRKGTRVGWDPDKKRVVM